MKQMYSRQLDVIKALAILFVVAFHFFPGHYGWHIKVMSPGWFENYWSGQGGLSVSVLQFLESYLYLGVNLFVIASGFGLYFSHLKSGKPMKLGEFFVKRIWRLMPAAILSVFVLFFVKGLLLGQWVTQNPLLNLFPFLGGLNLFSDHWFFPPVNGETWFLGLVIQLYLFFPLLVRMYEKLGEKRFLLLLFLTSVAFRCLYYVFWKDAVSSLSYGLSVGRLFEFGFGMVLARHFMHGKTLSPWWMAGTVFGLGYFWPWSFPFADSLFGVGFFACVWLLATRFPLEGKAAAGAATLAAQSYLIFLLHHPLIWVLESWGFHDAWSPAGLFVFVLFCIFAYGFARMNQWVLDRLSSFFGRAKSLRHAHGDN